MIGKKRKDIVDKSWKNGDYGVRKRIVIMSGGVERSLREDRSWRVICCRLV